MYYEDYDNAGYQEKNGDDVYSKPVRAGKRTYFFDVKATKGNDYYLTITESKRRIEHDGRYVYDKHKIFLYKEDFSKFIDALSNAIRYIYENDEFPAEPETDQDDEEPGYEAAAPTEEPPVLPAEDEQPQDLGGEIDLKIDF